MCSVRPLAHHGSIGHRLTVDTDIHTGLSSGTEAVSGTEDFAAAMGEYKKQFFFIALSKD